MGCSGIGHLHVFLSLQSVLIPAELAAKPGSKSVAISPTKTRTIIMLCRAVTDIEKLDILRVAATTNCVMMWQIRVAFNVAVSFSYDSLIKREATCGISHPPPTVWAVSGYMRQSSCSVWQCSSLTALPLLLALRSRCPCCLYALRFLGVWLGWQHRLTCHFAAGSRIKSRPWPCGP